MREILFRGKRLDNGEWVEGASINDRNGALYICPAVSDITYGDNGKRRRIGCWYSVDLFSVGQYTGLTDKNGERIFEGDIIESRYDYFDLDYVVVEVVKWFRNGWVSQGVDCLPYSFTEDGILPYAEIIGNIHDNPELLGKKSGVEQ